MTIIKALLTEIFVRLLFEVPAQLISAINVEDNTTGKENGVWLGVNVEEEREAIESIP